MKKLKIWGFVLLYVMCTTLTACGGDNSNNTPTTLNVNPDVIKLYYEETRQLSSEGATSWNSENEFVAKVDNTGLVKGGHVGTTNVFASNDNAMGKCTVTIIPKHDLYDTPIIEWGATINTIMSKETHKLLSYTSDNYLGYDYSKNRHSALLLYGFENSQLKSVSILMSLYDYTNAGDYLLERYQPISIDKANYQIIFIDAMTADNAKNVVALETTEMSNQTMTMIMYIQHNSATKVSAVHRSAVINNLSIPEEMLSILKK